MNIRYPIYEGVYRILTSGVGVPVVSIAVYNWGFTFLEAGPFCLRAGSFCFSPEDGCRY